MTCHGHRTCTCESLMPCMALSVNGTRGKTTDWDDVQWEMGMVMGFARPVAVRVCVRVCLCVL